MKLPYKTITLEEIKSIPINKIANIGCHVYCWTTNKFLNDTFKIFKSWGVNYHLTLVWTKPSFIAPAMGYQFATEFLLLGFYQKPMLKFKKIGLKNWINTPQTRNKHSKKPKEFYTLIDKMSPSPKLEMFARDKKDGWDYWGDEV
jgi:N6-adenosine-specific RNA methylase IME4